MTPEQISKVVGLLQSHETSLKQLAREAGEDPFTFYRGATLTSLDLSGQDLTGMNFDRADIRFSNLENVIFDAGAFNGSFLDDAQAWLQDEYEFYAEDLLTHPIDEILIFCKFRPRLVETVLAYAGITYLEFSKFADVSANALRKARRGQVVAHETASKILQSIDKLFENKVSTKIDPLIVRLTKQPILIFLSGGTNMQFQIVSRERMKELVHMRAELFEARSTIFPGYRQQDWRDTPYSIESDLNFYRNLQLEREDAAGDRDLKHDDTK